MIDFPCTLAKVFSTWQLEILLKCDSILVTHLLKTLHWYVILPRAKPFQWPTRSDLISSLILFLLLSHCDSIPHSSPPSCTGFLSVPSSSQGPCISQGCSSLCLEWSSPDLTAPSPALVLAQMSHSHWDLSWTFN